MSSSVQVNVNDVRRVYELLDKLRNLFHQPLYYRDPNVVERFADENYSEIMDLYYKTVWEWLPEDVRRSIEEG